MSTSETELIRDTVRSLISGGGSVIDELDAQDWFDFVPDDLRAGWVVLFEETAKSLSAAPVLDYFLANALGVAGATVIYPGGYVHGDWSSAESFIQLERGTVHAAAGVNVRKVHGIDPDFGLGLAELRDEGSSELDPTAVAEAVASGRLLQSFALNALSGEMLRLALDHVMTREQFGRTLATFQAVKHQLADSAVALDAARTAADFAAEELHPVAVLAARALAGRAAFDIGRTAHQMMGAMGFTWEVPLHFYVRRTHVVDLMLGPWERLASELGAQLIADGRAPRLGDA